MSEPLDDFNRRRIDGSAGLALPPARNAAESAADAFTAAARPASPAGGGSIAFGPLVGAGLTLLGCGLFLSGSQLLETSQGGPAILGILLLLLSAALLLIGIGALGVSLLGGLGSLGGWLRLGLAAVAALAGVWATPWLWPLGLFPPAGLVALAAAAVALAALSLRG